MKAAEIASVIEAMAPLGHRGNGSSGYSGDLGQFRFLYRQR